MAYAAIYRWRATHLRNVRRLFIRLNGRWIAVNAYSNDEHTPTGQDVYAASIAAAQHSTYITKLVAGENNVQS